MKAHRKGEKWTLEQIQNEADKCTTLTEFREGNVLAYSAATRHHKFSQIIQDLAKARDSSLTLTFEGLRELALKCKTKMEFRKRFPYGYQVAVGRDDFKDIVSHMPKTYSKWTFNKIRKIVLTCNDLNEFRLDHQVAYTTACAKGILKEVTAGLKRRAITFDEVESIAASCTTKAEFILHTTAYNAAGRLGKDYRNSLTAHMTDGRKAA